MGMTNGDGKRIGGVRGFGFCAGQQDIDHVFDPFYQAPGASRSGHAGLGLAIARRMAELQQGRVSVESQPGEGAEFRFWLPLADSAAKESTEL